MFERTRRILGERAQVGDAAGLVPILARLDRFEHGNHVGRPAGFDQLADMAKDATVVVAYRSLPVTRSATLSHAWLSSSRPPSRDCSASTDAAVLSAQPIVDRLRRRAPRDYMWCLGDAGHGKESMLHKKEPRSALSAEKQKGPERALMSRIRESAQNLLIYQISPSTDTVILTMTSVCSAIAIWGRQPA